MTNQTEKVEGRIEGEFHYAVLGKSNVVHVCRKSDNERVREAEPMFWGDGNGVEQIVKDLDEQARHHRAAALRSVDEAAEKLERFKWSQPNGSCGALWVAGISTPIYKTKLSVALKESQLFDPPLTAILNAASEGGAGE